MQVMKMLTREKHTKLLSHFICTAAAQKRPVHLFTYTLPHVLTS